jgi:hypothetical protein
MTTVSPQHLLLVLMILASQSSWVAVAGSPAVDSENELIEDRLLVERIYYDHRLGDKPPFEKTLPRESMRAMIRLDQKKQVVLQAAYGLEVTPEMVQAEMRRMETTTRAPGVLDEIKVALAHDPKRFARAVARPVVVDRELRRRFENDDTLHAAPRRIAESAREKLLAKETVEGMHEVHWQMTPHLKQSPSSLSSLPTTPTSVNAASSVYTVEATAQIAQVITSPDQVSQAKEKAHFKDLDPGLQRLLNLQLQKPGDVSAVIETSSGFLVFQATQRSAETLSAFSLSVPKRSYDEWLVEQPD